VCVLVKCVAVFVAVDLQGRWVVGREIARVGVAGILEFKLFLYISCDLQVQMNESYTKSDGKKNVNYSCRVHSAQL